MFDRTAEVVGYAEPGAWVDVVGGKTHKTVEADAVTGEWSTTVEGLALGENPFTYEAFDNENESLGKSEFTVDVPVTELSGVVQSTSVFSRTAVVEVTGTPGLTLNYQDRNTRIGRDGKATVMVDGLDLGPNEVAFTQYDGANPVGTELKYAIELSTKKITATAEFDSRGIEHDAIISGTAEAQADITIIDSNGKLTTTTAGEVGTWSTTVTAPGAGRQTFEARQTINGADGGAIQTTLVYGAGVDLTSPRDDSEFDGGDLTFRGTGQSGTRVEITEKGVDEPLVSTVVTETGNWAAKVTDIDGNYKHTYTATMHSQGNLTTTDTVVVNPDKDEASAGVTQPFELSTPSDESTVIAPTNEVTFAGKGTTGARVEIMNASNSRVIGTTEIGKDGTWSTAGVVGFGDQKIRAKVTTNGQVQNVWIDIRVEASAGVEQPFALTTPVDGAEVIAPTNEVTFTGTGTTGDTVAIVNTYNGRVVASTTVDSTGNWSKAGVVGFGMQNLRATVTHQGVPTDHPFSVIVKAAAGVERPFAITTPENGSTVVAPNNMVTFSGTGTTGARVIITTGTGRGVIDTTVREDGTWSGSGFLGHQYYELGTSYTPLGGAPVTGTTTVTVKASDDVINPFAITTPENDSTVVAPNNLVTFTGTGAAGATVQLINDAGGQYERVVAQATVRPDGTWTATGGLGHQRYTLSYTHTPGIAGGTPASGTTTLTVVAQ